MCACIPPPSSTRTTPPTQTDVMCVLYGGCASALAACVSSLKCTNDKHIQTCVPSAPKHERMFMALYARLRLLLQQSMCAQYKFEIKFHTHTHTQTRDGKDGASCGWCSVLGARCPRCQKLPYRMAVARTRNPHHHHHHATRATTANPTLTAPIAPASVAHTHNFCGARVCACSRSSAT